MISPKCVTLFNSSPTSAIRKTGLSGNLIGSRFEGIEILRDETVLTTQILRRFISECVRCLSIHLGTSRA